MMEATDMIQSLASKQYCTSSINNEDLAKVINDFDLD